MSNWSRLPPSSRVVCDDVQIGENVQIGPDVWIECQRLRLGSGVRIGCVEDADFRAVAGVRVQARALDLDEGVVIGRCVRMRGGHLHLRQRVQIRDWNEIHVTRLLDIGIGGTVNEHCEIGGVDIQIGRELWMLPYAKIGGGSAFEVHSSLTAGHFLHLGMHSFVNTARAVILGDEVGLGTHTALYTHGAYPSELRGAPVAFAGVRIGDRSWLPGAIVNPGVTIGPDCVIGVGSVVTRDVPAGSLAAGVPCRVIQENAYPRELSPEERRARMTVFLHDLAEIYSDRHPVDFEQLSLEITLDGRILIAYREAADPATTADLRQRGMGRLIVLVYGEIPRLTGEGETWIDLDRRQIAGQACPLSERLLNQLRRCGSRFRYEARGGRYHPWEAE